MGFAPHFKTCGTRFDEAPLPTDDGVGIDGRAAL